METLINYPNPVLAKGRDDYNDSCSFDVSFDEAEIKVDEKYILIPAKCEIRCNGIEKLLQQEKASVVVFINSSAAFFRKVYCFDKGCDSTVIKIPKYFVKKSIEFCGYVIANVAIDDFYCEGEFNELYFCNTKFSVKPADYLAQGETRIIPVDNSELEKPITSIFAIVKNTEEMAIESVFDDEKIIIRLNESLNLLYYQMKDFNNGSMRRYLTAVIVYPVLVEAIAKMVENAGTDYSDYRWFRTIDFKLKELGVDLKQNDDVSYTDLANRLLGDIAIDGLRSVKETIDEETNNGEYLNMGGRD